MTNAGICIYTKGHEVVIGDEDSDNREYDPIEEQNGEYYLKVGWYEECEQINSEYDTVYISRKVTHWQPLPPAPSEENIKPYNINDMAADTFRCGKDTRTDAEIVIEYTEFYQEECHKTVGEILSKTKKASYQDATNVYLFTKLAELTLQVNRLKYPQNQ